MPATRFGLIGYGAWGSHHHARAIDAVAAELAAICSRSDASRGQAHADLPQAIAVAAELADELTFDLD